MEVRMQWSPSQPAPPMTGVTSGPDHSRSTDLLRESFNRLQQAEELRLQGKLDAAQAICEQLLEQYPDYWGALHRLGLVWVSKNNNE
jgi:hypothetical protein